MFFDLVVCEFEHLQPVGEGSLRGPRLCEIVDDPLISVGLLYVAVVEVDDGVAVGEHLSLHSVVEYHLLLAVLINPLYLSIVPYNLLHHLNIYRRFVVVLQREPHIVLLILLATFIVSHITCCCI